MNQSWLIDWLREWVVWIQIETLSLRHSRRNIYLPTGQFLRKNSKWCAIQEAAFSFASTDSLRLRHRVRRSKLDCVSWWWSDQQFVRAVQLLTTWHPRLLIQTYWLLLNWKVAWCSLQNIWLHCLTEGNIIFYLRLLAAEVFMQIKLQTGS